MSPFTWHIGNASLVLVTKSTFALVWTNSCGMVYAANSALCMASVVTRDKTAAKLPSETGSLVIPFDVLLSVFPPPCSPLICITAFSTISSISLSSFARIGLVEFVVSECWLDSSLFKSSVDVLTIVLVGRWVN